MFKQLMVDIETLGTGRDAAIASIGAVYFALDGVNREGRSDEFGFEFHRRIVFNDSMGNIDAGTVLWWLLQPKEAQERLVSDGGVLRSNLFDALSDFNSFAGDCEGFWSNGPMFDERILREANERRKSRLNVHFRLSRCFRTYVDLAAGLELDTLVERVGIHHDALDDAKTQARVISKIHRQLVELRKKGD